MNKLLLIALAIVVIVLVYYFFGRAPAASSSASASSASASAPAASLGPFTYLGTFNDNSSRVIPTQYKVSLTDVSGAYNILKAAGLPAGTIFGIQDASEGNGKTGAMFYGPSTSAYSSLGVASDSGYTDAAGNKLGGPWTNAVYRLN